MNFDILKDSIDAKKTKDDATTVVEHTAIILRYKQTGCLDRDDAIKKYTEFNDNHPDYYIPMRTTTISAGTAARISEVSDETVIENLSQQLRYLTGKNLLEELKHAQPTT